jgi:hypothetical protein
MPTVSELGNHVVQEPAHSDYDGAGVSRFVSDMGENRLTRGTARRSWASFGFEIDDACDLGDRILLLDNPIGLEG